MTLLAVLRPSDWELPLFLHVLGAMVLVGGLILAFTTLLAGWRGGGVAVTRLGFRALLLTTLPGWLVMRVAAEWIASKEHLEDSNASWIGIGFSTADGGLLFLIVATVLAGIAARKARRAAEEGAEPGGAALNRIATVLAAILLVAYLVTLWAMSAKPD